MLWVLLLLPLAVSQHTAKWDRCGCRWDTWQSWSICSRQCYGSQIRQRKVWHHDIAGCQTFEDCDAGAGGYVRRDCNTHCDAGHYNGYRCVCPPGRNGVCCGNVVTCAAPAGLVHGRVQGNRYQYSDTITYSCDQSFNLTGIYRRTCMENGGWSGAKPRCQFAESCSSNPCQNGGTCINGLDKYDCMCQTGWTGKNCEVDIQPPVFDQCPTNRTIHTSDREINSTWQVPIFRDPHGTPVKTTSNYAKNNHVFPWGDYTVQYRAVKESNGLETTCIFVISIRPNPCPAVIPPINGYTVCNGWRADFGQFCLLGCNTNYTLPGSFDPRQWLVCGASGHWSTVVPSQCKDAFGPASNTVLTPGDCYSDTTAQREDYLQALKRSSYNSVCIGHNALCTKQNVKVTCGA